jgi:xylan 1,4-beta-xylosidase
MVATMNARLLFLLLLLIAAPSRGQWLVLPPFDQRQTTPPQNWSEGKAIKVGDAWPTDQKFRWLGAVLTLPERIEGKSCAGEPIGLRINCGDGGEVWVNGELQGRYDNDHPALALVSERAVPGQKVRVAIQVYGKVQGGDRFSEGNWTIIEPKRARETLKLKVHPEQLLGPVPNGIVGLSQGGGMSDYEAATAKKLREGGFKWFRMDNVLTGTLKKGADGKLVDDWSDFDKRLDFMAQIGAEPIICVSYMPQVLDAVPNGERQSAPRDYGVWEELCFRAARHAIQRGTRVPFWEVWNEVNAGWLKPGREDTGGEPFKSLYNQALGKAETDHEVVRRFEAYCKLYRATARGVRRADPDAKIGGPALASGPFENSEHGSCQHGRGFARGLILYCARENLPLDFVSWHEYFQEASMIAEEARAFRGYLADQPRLAKSVRSFMITEWNEAWWADRPHDHELGAAWCADGIVRAMLPEKIDRPCFFYVKQNDMNFRGDFSLLMQDNRPKASYNMAKIFNGLSGQWVSLTGTDGEVSGVAAWDQKRQRLAIVLVNFSSRYGVPRRVAIEIEKLPRELRNGVWSESIVDSTHGNIWHDQARAELTMCKAGSVRHGRFEFNEKLMPNSVTLIEVSVGDR